MTFLFDDPQFDVVEFARQIKVFLYDKVNYVQKTFLEVCEPGQRRGRGQGPHMQGASSLPAYPEDDMPGADGSLVTCVTLMAPLFRGATHK
ncbi:hypothetical protein ACFVEN_44345 [Streptomyces sp. NPDC057681]|uniref:hypothetical protein n=1 Tax=Streptomyces sp. NPDC057681 TaxID=3346209 RepID=UPI0036CA5376